MECEAEVLANKKGVQYRRMPNRSEELGRDNEIPHSGQVYMYVKKELLPNFHYYKHRFRKAVRSINRNKRFSKKNGVGNKAVAKEGNMIVPSYNKMISYMMYSAEHLREHYWKHYNTVFGKSHTRPKKSQVVPVELAFTTEKDIYSMSDRMPRRLTETAIEWADAHEDVAMERKENRESVELEPCTEYKRYNVPMKSQQVNRGAGKAFSEILDHQPRIEPMWSPDYGAGMRNKKLPTSKLGPRDDIPHSGQAYMYIRKKDLPYYYRRRWQNACRSVLGNDEKRLRFDKAIAKPPKLMRVPGVTDKGYNLAFYTESADGTGAIPLRQWRLPADSTGFDRGNGHNVFPQQQIEDEGFIDIPRHSMQIPQVPNVPKLPTVNYVKRAKTEEISTTFDTNRPIEFMLAETLDPDKDINSPNWIQSKDKKNDIGYYFKGPRTTEVQPYENSDRRRLKPLITNRRENIRYESPHLPSAIKGTSELHYQIQDPRSNVSRVHRGKAREFEHQYWRRAPNAQMAAASETVKHGDNVDIDGNVTKPSCISKALSKSPGFATTHVTDTPVRGIARNAPRPTEDQAGSQLHSGDTPMDTLVKFSVDPTETLDSARHISRSGMVYMYERPRKPQVYYKDGKFVARDPNKLWFNEWTAKQAHIHRKTQKYDEAIQRSLLDKEGFWRRMYAHPMHNLKFPTYAIAGEDEDGLQELPFREHYDTPQLPDTESLRKVPMPRPDYEKDGSGYHYDVMSGAEQAAHENLDYDRPERVAKGNPKEDQFDALPYQAPRSTKYEFPDQIIPDKHLPSIATHQPYHQNIGRNVMSAGAAEAYIDRGMLDSQPAAVTTSQTQGDGTPMYNYFSGHGQRVDAAETLDPKRNVITPYMYRGRGLINEGPVDDAALTKEYMNRSEPGDETNIEGVAYRSAPDNHMACHIPSLYPIVPDTMSRTPREYALWNTPARVRPKELSPETFDDPLAYRRPEIEEQMAEQTLDPTQNIPKPPQVPLYTKRQPNQEGQPWHRYSFAGRQDSFDNDYPASFMSQYVDGCYQLPGTNQLTPYKYRDGAVAVTDHDKSNIVKYSEIYEGPLGWPDDDELAEASKDIYGNWTKQHVNHQLYGEGLHNSAWDSCNRQHDIDCVRDNVGECGVRDGMMQSNPCRHAAINKSCEANKTGSDNIYIYIYDSLHKSMWYQQEGMGIENGEQEHNLSHSLKSSSKKLVGKNLAIVDGLDEKRTLSFDKYGKENLEGTDSLHEDQNLNSEQFGGENAIQAKEESGEQFLSFEQLGNENVLLDSEPDGWSQKQPQSFENFQKEDRSETGNFFQNQMLSSEQIPRENLTETDGLHYQYQPPSSHQFEQTDLVEAEPNGWSSKQALSSGKLAREYLGGANKPNQKQIVGSEQLERTNLVTADGLHQEELLSFEQFKTKNLEEYGWDQDQTWSSGQIRQNNLAETDEVHQNHALNFGKFEEHLIETDGFYQKKALRSEKLSGLNLVEQDELHQNQFRQLEVKKVAETDGLHTEEDGSVDLLRREGSVPMNKPSQKQSLSHEQFEKENIPEADGLHPQYQTSVAEHVRQENLEEAETDGLSQKHGLGFDKFKREYLDGVDEQHQKPMLSFDKLRGQGITDESEITAPTEQNVSIQLPNHQEPPEMVGDPYFAGDGFDNSLADQLVGEIEEDEMDWIEKKKVEWDADEAFIAKRKPDSLENIPSRDLSEMSRQRYSTACDCRSKDCIQQDQNEQNKFESSLMCNRSVTPKMLSDKSEIDQEEEYSVPTDACEYAEHGNGAQLRGPFINVLRIGSGQSNSFSEEKPATHQHKTKERTDEQLTQKSEINAHHDLGSLIVNGIPTEILKSRTMPMLNSTTQPFSASPDDQKSLEILQEHVKVLMHEERRSSQEEDAIHERRTSLQEQLGFELCAKKKLELIATSEKHLLDEESYKQQLKLSHKRIEALKEEEFRWFKDEIFVKKKRKSIQDQLEKHALSMQKIVAKSEDLEIRRNSEIAQKTFPPEDVNTKTERAHGGELDKSQWFDDERENMLMKGMIYNLDELDQQTSKSYEKLISQELIDSLKLVEIKRLSQEGMLRVRRTSIEKQLQQEQEKMEMLKIEEKILNANLQEGDDSAHSAWLNKLTELQVLSERIEGLKSEEFIILDRENYIKQIIESVQKQLRQEEQDYFNGTLVAGFNGNVTALDSTEAFKGSDLASDHTGRMHDGHLVKDDSLGEYELLKKQFNVFQPSGPLTPEVSTFSHLTSYGEVHQNGQITDINHDKFIPKLQMPEDGKTAEDNPSNLEIKQNLWGNIEADAPLAKDITVTKTHSHSVREGIVLIDGEAGVETDSVKLLLIKPSVSVNENKSDNFIPAQVDLIDEEDTNDAVPENPELEGLERRSQGSLHSIVLDNDEESSHVERKKEKIFKDILDVVSDMELETENRKKFNTSTKSSDAKTKKSKSREIKSTGKKVKEKKQVERKESAEVNTETITKLEPEEEKEQLQFVFPSEWEDELNDANHDISTAE